MMGYIGHLSFCLMEASLQAVQAPPTIYIVLLAFIINDMAIVTYKIKYFNIFGEISQKFDVYCYLFTTFCNHS
jgi:hypothetical protein